MEDRALRSLWCDGFIPEQFLLEDPTPRITGRTWIGIGPRKQERWEFTLFLPRPVRTREDLSWDELGVVPPDGPRSMQARVSV